MILLLRRDPAHDRPSLLRAITISLIALLVVAGLMFASIAPASARTSYRLDTTHEASVHLDWKTRWVRVRTTMELKNTSGGPIHRLLLNTIAAKLGSMRYLKVRVDGVLVPRSVGGQTISVSLPSALAAGETAKVYVSFQARLGTSRSGRSWLWSKIDGVAHLYRFIPWVSRSIPFGTQAHGEPFLTPTSSRVRVEVSSNRKLVWATSGRRIAKDGKSRTFVAHDVRDFAIAASPGYRTVSGKSKDGRTTIFAHTRRHDGRRLVRLAREELARYQNKTGIRYPHPTYRIAETAAGLAMESPGLIWIPRARSAADHPFLVSHETAHQWFYSSVGNDQATDAFADEALADYFARRAHLSLRASRCKNDRLDRNIRGYSSRCYFEVIYVQGARFLDGLRRDFGSKKFQRAIRSYSAQYRNGLGSNAKLLEAFRAEMGNGVLPRYRKRFPSLY